MKIGIVTVTYNSQKDIGRLLDSIKIQDYKNLSVYVVDNNSTDRTLEIVSEYNLVLPIRLIPSLVNNGFARGNNIGIQIAMDESCELVFILNPDMQLEKNCIDILVKRIISDEKIGVIGPVVLFSDKPGRVIQSYGIKANFRTQKKAAPFSNSRWSTEIPSEIYVDYLIGGAMMIKSKVLSLTGFFEEDYFMYNDELDLAYRVRKSGYKTVCVRDAMATHYHDFSNKNRSGHNLMYYYIVRNRYLYFKKYKMYLNLIGSLVLEFFNIPLKIIWSIRRMRNFYLLKYYYAGLLDGLLGKKGYSNRSFLSKNSKADYLQKS